MIDYDKGFRDGLAAANAVALDLENRWRARDTKEAEAAADGIKAIRGIVETLLPRDPRLPQPTRGPATTPDDPPPQS